MNGYFYVLTAIDLFVLSFMCILTKLSESLNKKQKQGFFFAFALIAVISVLEVVLSGLQGHRGFVSRYTKADRAKVHTVTVRQGTLLSRLLGQDTVLVNSQHHQAADRIAPELEIAALSEDGIVEALEKPDAHFCLGVQWHPEWLSDADPAQQGLFGAFVEACRG